MGKEGRMMEGEKGRVRGRILSSEEGKEGEILLFHEKKTKNI